MTRIQRPSSFRVTDVRLLYPLLPHLARGATDDEIATHMNLTGSGVKSRLKSLYTVLGAANRAHAVAIAYEQGLIPLGTVTKVERP